MREELMRERERERQLLVDDQPRGLLFFIVFYVKNAI